MIAYLCDTDWTIEYLNGSDDASRLFSSLADDGLGISIVTYGELYEGVLTSTRRESRVRQLEELVTTVDVLSIDFETARQFAEIRSLLRRGGQPIPDMDALIAATAIRYDLTLITYDHHFDRVTGLKVRADDRPR